MSPLAYTDMYLITSISDELEGRVKCEYVISKDNNKVFCSLLSKEQTEEDTGVGVSFEIKSNDVNLLCKYVKHNIRFIYDRCINVDGEPHHLVAVKYKGSNFYHIANSNGNEYGQLVGLIGGMPNNIKLFDYKDYMDASFYMSLERINYDVSLAFDIEIGSVDQSADKDIQMSEKTKVYIAKRLKEIIKEFKEYVLEKAQTLDHWDDVHKFLTESSMLFSPTLWKGNKINTVTWLGDKVTFHKTKKGNVVQTKNVGNHFSIRCVYYYNDLGFIPSIKTLLNYIPDLQNTYIVNNIDNNIYNLRLLSSVVPKTVPVPSKVKRTRNRSDNKCYKLSNHVGSLGRELNIDLTKDNYYISMEVYNKPLFNGSLRHQLSVYTQKDIYVVNDVSLVGEDWIDLIAEIAEKCKDIDTNFFKYMQDYDNKVICYMDDKDMYMRMNPDSCISKLLSEIIKYSKYNYTFYNLIYNLYLDQIIKIKEPAIPLDKLVEEVDRIYPLLENSVRHKREYITMYIELVDQYKKTTQEQQ